MYMDAEGTLYDLERCPGRHDTAHWVVMFQKYFFYYIRSPKLVIISGAKFVEIS